MKKLAVLIMILALVGIVLMGGACQKIKREPVETPTILWENNTNDTIIIGIEGGVILGLYPGTSRLYGDDKLLGRIYQVAGEVESDTVKSRNTIN